MADKVDDEPSAASEAIRLAEISARLATREHTLPQGKLSDLYQPLDKSRNEIRILRLLPYGYPDGMIHCHLETRSLQDDQLLYNAVSYAWGDATETAELCCNLAIVRVTKGLHSALKNLRSLLNTVEEELHLWIDGLCINQEDPDERSSQVLIMHIIYHQAANTIVWLGEEADDSAWAMAVAKRMGESKTLDATKPETWAEFPELYDNKFWTAVHHLFNRPFWTRLWVLQEITVSSSITVSCGRSELPWSLLERARLCWSDISWNDPWSHFPPDIVRSLISNSFEKMLDYSDTRFDRHRAARDDPPILVRLNASLALRCSDPRDKIYALLGISSDDYQIIPDYTASVHDVYTNLISNKLVGGHNAVILFLSGNGVFYPEDRTPGLPSWVCDWAAWSTYATSPIPIYRPIFFYQRQCFSATADMTCTVETQPGSDVLKTKGIFCDEVRSSVQNVYYQKEFWGRFARATATEKYPTGMPLLQALFRVVILDTERGKMVRLGEDRGLLAKLVAGFLLFLYLSPQYMTDEEIAKALDEQELSALDAFHLWRKRYLTDAERNEETVTAEEMILGEEWQDLDLKSIHERISPRACFELARDRCNFNADMTAFFETEKGYFGIGPILTEPEDEIFALPGLEIPFVMCAQDDNYEMLGPCFVLGFMDGEAVELMNSGQSQLQDLVVR